MRATMTTDITATLTGRSERCDLGVPGSPVWYEVADITLDTLYMFGREWTRGEVNEEFGKLAEYLEDSVEAEEFE